MENDLTVPTLDTREPVGSQRQPRSHVPMRRFVLLLATMFMAVSFSGAAMSPASAEGARESQTWVGSIEQHGSHFDYVGRSCPVEVDICVALETRYRIVPVTRDAMLALPSVSGGNASVGGFLIEFRDRGHAGFLIVERVTPPPATA